MTDEQSQELYYQAPFPLYGVGFSRSPNHPARAAVTSFIPTSSNNKLQIVDRLPSQGDHAASQEGNNHHFVPLATASHPFPPSRVTWEPNPAASRLTSRGEHEASTELLATTGDALRIWQATDGSGSDQDDDGYDQVAKSKSNKTRIELRERSKLTNGKVPAHQVPPLTSFSWSEHSPNLIVTSSIDTTCTLWDIHTSTALTQLIAHDRAVHDVSFLPHSSDVFVSVGSDGSLRAFDLRALEHSTILYEDSKNRPLMRVDFGSKEQHYLGIFGMGDDAVQILDMRSPGTAVTRLVGHEKKRDGCINAIAWGCETTRSSPGGPGWLASCGDDGQMLVYDCSQPLPDLASASTSAPGSRTGSATGSDRHHSPSKSGTSAQRNEKARSGSSLHPGHQQPYPSSSPGSGTTPNASRTSGGGGSDPSRSTSAGRSASSHGKDDGSSTSSIPRRYPAFAWTNHDYTPSTTGQQGEGGRASTTVELNNLAWGVESHADQGVWLGVVGGNRLNCLRF